MASLVVYLGFDGNCREAMDFYHNALGGETQYMTYGQAPMPTPEEHNEKIMHSHLIADGIKLMAADTMPGQPYNPGNNYTLTLNCTSENELDGIWGKLSADASISLPIDNQFWGAKYGQLTDKFGVNWALNYEFPKA
jgi:PhnB protein